MSMNKKIYRCVLSFFIYIVFFILFTFILPLFFFFFGWEKGDRRGRFEVRRTVRGAGFKWEVAHISNKPLEGRLV